MCERLDLIDKECAPFFVAFKKMDKSKDGEISCHEFFKFYKIPYNDFVGRLFRGFNVDTSSSEDDMDAKLDAFSTEIVMAGFDEVLEGDDLLAPAFIPEIEQVN